MEQALQFFIFLPLLGFIRSFVFSNSKEKIISSVAILTVGSHLLLLLSFTIYWAFNGFNTLDYKHFTFYNEDSIEIFLDFYFDVLF